MNITTRHIKLMVIGDNIEEQLAPFSPDINICPKELLVFFKDEESPYDWETEKNGYWHNPNSKWERCEIGGKWSGYFKLKKKSVNVECSKPNGYVDQALVKDIDMDATFKQTKDKAERVFNKIASIVGVDYRGHIRQPELTWDECKLRVRDLGKASQLYDKQLVMKKYRSKELAGYVGFIDIKYFDCDLQEYIRRSCSDKIATYAIVKGSKWIALGDGEGSETGEEAYEWASNFFDRFIKPLPENTLLTIVDCMYEVFSSF
jgi:hypothetical protein